MAHELSLGPQSQLLQGKFYVQPDGVVPTTISTRRTTQHQYGKRKKIRLHIQGALTAPMVWHLDFGSTITLPVHLFFPLALPQLRGKG